MIRRTTTFLAALLCLFLVREAAAQDPTVVTVRQINEIPDDQVQQLLDAGTDLQSGDISGLIFNDLNGARVQFTAVIMSDPLNSGLANQTDGRVDRIHVFVRDVAAATEGPDGMGIQLVDGAYETTGLINTTVGDVVEVVGTVGPFGNTMQIAPETITVLGRFDDANFNLGADFMDPVVVTTAEVNMSVDASGGVQPNWTNLWKMRGQFVEFQNVTVTTRDISSDRPNWLITSDDGTTIGSFYDISIRFRNDRDDYPDEWNKRSDDFVPPVPGSLINVKAFINFQGDDPFARGVPSGAILSFNPFEDNHLEVLQSPPQVSDLSQPDFVPTQNDVVAVTATVTTDPSRTLASAILKYTTSSNATAVSVAPTVQNGDVFTFPLPPLNDGECVTYFIEATDNTGAVTESDPEDYRVLADGVNEIKDIQETCDGGPGDTPLRGIDTDMDLTAIVHSNPDASGFISLQDSPDLDPWSGILLNDSNLPELHRGDMVHITHATIDRVSQFGFSQWSALSNVTLEVISSGNDIYGYKELDTDAVADESIAKAHEGMLVRYPNVRITDSDAGFGEWLFATENSDGSLQAEARADDASPLVSGGGGFAGGELLEHIQGILVFAFNNFRIWPEDPATDFGTLLNVAIEDEALPGSFVLHQNFPNPFNPATSIRYDVARTGKVTLEVFDLLGRRIATLVDGEQAAGQHTVRFDAGELASGMYLYRLHAGTQVLTRTMVLLK